jgi:sugar phosphate isomerase/epimerase
MALNKLAIASVSLSLYAGHLLDEKIRTAAQHGYSGIEIVYSDLETYSKSQNIPIHTAAQKINQICNKNNVKTLSLAPFENFEGANSPLETRLQLAKHWLEIARLLKAPYLQVPSIFTNDCSRDAKVITTEMQALADLASATKPTVSIAYEALSWGTNHSTWESALDLVNSVNRPNFGLCMDTFHEATKIWGDPSSPSGKQMYAEERLRDSLRRFVRDCPLEKLFYVQLSDGERFDPPYSVMHPWAVLGEAKEFTWSRHARPFPFESEFGGYLPVGEIARAWIVEMGFKGWVSMEVFDRRLRDGSVSVEAAARRGVESWRKVQAEMEEKPRL